MIFPLEEFKHRIPHWPERPDPGGLRSGQFLLSKTTVLLSSVWEAAHVRLKSVTLDTDTTVHTLFGQQMGARKGYNPQHKGKKSYQPILAFLAETREYVMGELHNGDRPSGSQIARHLERAWAAFPPGVKTVFARADSGFYCWEAVESYEKHGCQFIISARKTTRLVDALKAADWKPSPRTETMASEARCRLVYMAITTDLVQAFLECPTKCFLRWLGETGVGNTYADWVCAQSTAYQREGSTRLKGGANGECVIGPLDRKKLKSATWRMATESKVCAQDLACSPGGGASWSGGQRLRLHFRSQGPASWLLDDRRSKRHRQLRRGGRGIPLRWLLIEGPERSRSGDFLD